MMRCEFCLKPGHLKQDCPEVGTITFYAAEPVPPADDAEEARVIRIFQLRAYARGLLADLRKLGAEPSPETLALQPPTDSFDP